MKFWDGSAVVSLIVHENTTKALQTVFARDPVVLVWWATKVECASALLRRERAGALSVDATREAFARLDSLAATWHLVEPVVDLRDAAIRLLRVHDLRAAGALQLAAAYIGSERRPGTLEFVCRDDRLARAAEREGFPLR
jgi:uncharacterized protein